MQAALDVVPLLTAAPGVAPSMTGHLRRGAEVI